MALDGSSASQIGLSLGRTRSSIIGKLHRMGMTTSWERKAADPGAATARRVAWMRRKRAAALSAQPTLGRRYALRMAAAVPSGPGITIFDLADNTCRYIAGDAIAAETLYCGAVTEIGRPYCPAHCAICFNAPAA